MPPRTQAVVVVNLDTNTVDVRNETMLATLPEDVRGPLLDKLTRDAAILSPSHLVAPSLFRAFPSAGTPMRKHSRLASPCPK